MQNLFKNLCKNKPTKKILATLLLVGVTSCNTPPPNVPVCQIDLPRNRAICFTIVSQEGPTFVPIESMDKWTTMSPESNLELQKYVKSLRRQANQCSQSTKSP